MPSQNVRPSSSLPIVNRHENDDEVMPDAKPLRDTTVRQELHPHLLFKAFVSLKDMTTDWPILQNRPVFSNHLERLKTAFGKQGILKSAPEHRIF